MTAPRMTDGTTPMEQWADTQHKQVLGAIALAAAGFFADEGGVNYVEFGLEGLPNTGPLAIIVQRKEGKSAHQLRTEAEAALSAALARVRRLEEALNEALDGWHQAANSGAGMSVDDYATYLRARAALSEET